MTGLLKTIVAALFGAALGLGATWYALGGGVSFGFVELGPWRGNPRAAYADADPYTRAARARTGQSPLSQAEGLTFFASVDDDGARLDPRCAYTIGGAIPAARLWTLSSLDRNGKPIANAVGRNAISSIEIVRDQDGRFEIAVASEARAGNWLPIARNEPFQLMLRLYDATGSAAAGVMAREQMPAISKGSCS
ncbi:MAG: DUF1214 domain-containing protein [Beijerinckiaceae bacterium]|nr:DUF1214 domain-containing protein [Beijerinckiaceae bacterium]